MLFALLAKRSQLHFIRHRASQMRKVNVFSAHSKQSQHEQSTLGDGRLGQIG